MNTNKVQTPTIGRDTCMVIGIMNNLSFPHVMLNTGVMALVLHESGHDLSLSEMTIVVDESTLNDGTKRFNIESWLQKNQIVSQGQEVTTEIAVSFLKQYAEVPQVSAIISFLEAKTTFNAEEIFKAEALNYGPRELVEKFIARMVTFLDEYTEALSSQKVLDYIPRVSAQDNVVTGAILLTLIESAQFSVAETMAIQAILLGKYQQEFSNVIITSDGSESDVQKARLLVVFGEKEQNTQFLKDVAMQLNKAETEYGSSSGDVEVWNISGFAVSQTKDSSIPVAHRPGNWNGVLKLALKRVLETQPENVS